LGAAPVTAAHLLAGAEQALTLDLKSPLHLMLMRCAAEYLGVAVKGDKPLDPVARFHLGNGARIERINWGGDRSAKGLRQSYGMMVNYLYDLKRLDKYRAQFSKGKVALASAVSVLRF
jgi:malonyl-CoA decarboxylase